MTMSWCNVFCCCCCVFRDDFRDLEGLKPSDDAINARLTTPVVATMLNTDNIAFTRYRLIQIHVQLCNHVLSLTWFDTTSLKGCLHAWVIDQAWSQDG